MKPEVKVGDKLKVKSNLAVGQKCGITHVISDMVKFADQEVTVGYVGPNYIHIYEDEGNWYWDLKMFDRCD
ncbi:hypothetical protein [Vagococcus salmoninarum]|uniref:hypothetical protein n=1 Tax=Vagococcus salmoninarum TaxID=2739 RepID=UPI00187ED8C1|nr:hypothetical protein [Vagococcus salmoninarum]MBE9387862.1 hypothetical protein [Vagococcus salmoninarum]